ncbi:MAG TPA: hypothetical protein VIU87_19200, partial [Mycobacterium sp.]
TATATSVVGAAGGLAGAGSSSTAVVAGNLEAFIGAGATVTVAGATIVTARSAATATADARGGAGGLALGISVFYADARIGRAGGGDPALGVRAYLGADATLQTGSLRIDAFAVDTATATLLAVAIGLASGAGGTATSRIDSNVEGYLGAPTGLTGTVLTATGLVEVLATASQIAAAPVTGGSGGGVTASSLRSTTTVASTVRAFLGDGVTVTTAGGLRVIAEVTNAAASSSVTVGGGGGISVGTVESRAISTGTTAAYLGDRVRVGSSAPVAGAVTIEAIGRGEADAVGNAYGGGGVVVGTPHASAFIDPTVDVHVGTTGAGPLTTTVAATGTISIIARLSKGTSTPIDVLGRVDIDADTLIFTYPGVVEGTQVMYAVRAGETQIDGLHQGSVYTVLDAGDKLIRLGSLIDMSGVDPLTETITIAAGHGFTSGDCVWYDPRGGVSIIGGGSQADDATHGCSGGTAPTAGAQRFFVRVLNPNQISLTATWAAATATSDATIDISPVAGDPAHTAISVPAGSGLTDGVLVVYRAPVTFSATSAFVNVTLVQQPGGTILVPGPGHDQSQRNIYVGSAAYGKLGTGDAVLYQQLSGTAGDGIGLGTDLTYFVILSGDGYTIQLAATYCQAVGPNGGAECAGIAVASIDLFVPTGTDDTQHRFAVSLGGLIDGRTYLVTNADAAAGTIELADPVSGTPIVLDATHRPGQHRLGIVEVDLRSGGGPDRQALFIDLVTPCEAACGHLLAPSGQPLNTVTPTVGDGNSAASAQGGSGGVGEFSFPYAEVTGTPSVSVVVAAASLIAGVDVVVLADSYFSVSASADAAGGGVISVGKASSSVELGTSPTTATLAAGTSITAGRDVSVNASTDHTLSSGARSVGGGLAGGKIAYTHAGVNDDTLVTVGANAVVLAGRAVNLGVDSGLTATTSSYTVAGGAGAGADSDNTNGGSRGVRIGSAGDTADRGIVINGGARITG